MVMRAQGCTLRLLLVCCLPFGGWAAGQNPTPGAGADDVRFRVDSYSNLYEVRVFDAAGNVVSGLRKEDVELRVGSRVTPVLLWQEQRRAPVSLAILVDLGSSMDEAAVRAAKQAIFELIHLLDPQDEILLGVYNRKVEFLAELTTDRLALVEALGNLTVGARPGFWKRMAQGFGTAALTGSAVDEALLRLKQARHPFKVVLVFSAAFGNLGRGTLDHLGLAGARFFGIGWKNRLGDAFGLGGDRMARGELWRESGGLVWEAGAILERMGLVAEALTHFYLAGWVPPETAGDDDRPEFRLRNCGDCRVTAGRRVAGTHPFY